MTALEILKVERAELMQKVKSIDKAIDLLEGNTVSIKWTERSLKCIGDKGRICLSADILECLFWDEPINLKDPRIRNNYMTGLSIALKKLVEGGNLKKQSRPGIKGFYYGLPQWFDENDKVKPDHDALKEMIYTIN